MADWEDVGAQPKAGGWEDVAPQRRATDAERRNDYVKTALAKPQWGEGIPKFAYDAGGKVTDLLSGLGLPSGVAAGGGYLANLATQAVPALFGGTVTQQVAKPAAEAAGRVLMTSALKPTLAAHTSGDAARAADTLLERGINPTMGGARKLQGSIDELERTISQISATTGATIDKAAMGAKIQDVIAKIDRSNPTPSSARAAAESVYNEFMSNPLIANKIPFQQAMDLKRGIYNMLGNAAYGIGLKPAAEADALKALGRGAREGMATAVPEIAAPLAEQSKLIEALGVAGRRAMMSQNHNPLSLGGSIGALSHDPTAAVGLWANSSDLAKSLLARGLYSGDLPFALGGGGLAGILATSQNKQRQ